MTTRAEAFAGPFPAGPEWVAAARTKLGLAGGDDEPIRAAAQGWMRLGSTRDATLVDTLFVLTDDRLGFGQTRFDTTDPNWVDLAAVHAMDLIEGVPYPLDAVEVQFVSGLAIFVGWPEEFTTEVLSLLRAHGAAAAMPPLFAPDPTVEEVNDVGEPIIDEGRTVAFGIDEDMVDTSIAEPERLPAPDHMLVEPPVVEAVEAVEAVAVEAVVVEPVVDRTAPDDAADDEGPEEAYPGDDQGFEPTAELRLAEEMFFGHLEADDHPTADSEDATGDEVELPEAAVEAAAAQVAGPWDDQDIAWPDAFRDCAFLGGHPIHQRRRKTCAVVIERRGIIAAAPRAGSWHLHVPWSDVARIDVQGPDEIKFTHNQRIGSDGSVLVIDLADDTSLLFEVRGMRPATLRAAVAGAQDAVGRIDAP